MQDALFMEVEVGYRERLRNIAIASRKAQEYLASMDRLRPIMEGTTLTVAEAYELLFESPLVTQAWKLLAESTLSNTERLWTVSPAPHLRSYGRERTHGLVLWDFPFLAFRQIQPVILLMEPLPVFQLR